MSDRPVSASPGYALGQLQRALAAAATDTDPATRVRATAKVDRWRAVLDGMDSGALTVGSRTPVRDLPSWVTLEVAHGGFATGRCLAESPLDGQELELLSQLPSGVPGSTDRERLNLWFLSDDGQAELLRAVRAERYVVDLPEHAALPTVALLLAAGRPEQALDLVGQLRPLLHRLRLTPRLTERPQLRSQLVHLEPVGAVTAALRQLAAPQQVRAMQEALRLWHPLYDALVGLWADTVETKLPHLVEQRGRTVVAGGWPAGPLPGDWVQRRADLLRWHDEVLATAQERSRHRHPKSNFQRLMVALRACPQDTSGLTPRDVGWVRRALANTISADGAPGSEQRAALRATQAVIAAQPTRQALAQVLAGRLDRYPADGGLPALDPIAGDVTADELAGLAEPVELPRSLLAKARRALEAPVDELVAAGVVPSADVLARLLPQITAQHLAASFSDAVAADVYARTYAAFRRRRSLLLLDLEHQVRLEELPWVAALEALRDPRRPEQAHQQHAVREALADVVLLALRGFPHALLPNPLVRELGALATVAGARLPLVEEVAADIFMGTFTAKWRSAASVTSSLLQNSLYARYYDLPQPALWQAPPQEPAGLLRRLQQRWGKPTAEDFAALCHSRATEAGGSGTADPWNVAANGTVLEQSQILTTQNLAVLVHGLELRSQLEHLAPELCGKVFSWILQSWGRLPAEHHPRLQAVKNIAYAWRQAMFLLSFCSPAEQRALLERLGEDVAVPPHTALQPVVAGLAAVLDGGAFDPHGRSPDGRGRRLLGWSVGPHWLLASRR